MIESFKKYLSGKIAISEKEFERIASVCHFKKLRKRQYLLQEGDVWKYNAFVLSGLVRMYNVDDKGMEHVLNFAKEDWWTGDRASLHSGKPSRFNIDAIEDTLLLLIEKEAFEQICIEIPQVNAMVHDIVERGFVASQERVLISKSYTAEEKYLDFIHKYPDFPVRIPQHMIASFLGITAETLSRVRNQTAKRN